MADYFLSDVHLRLDRLDRGQRLARLVDRLEHSDSLVIVGDLFDFWFASRQTREDPWRCPGLSALRAFRDRGGRIELLLGNHDAWLGSFFEENLELKVVSEPYVRESHGLRIRAAHGHRENSGKSRWKSWMEGRLFLKVFGALPSPVAVGLEALLDGVNRRGQSAADRLLVERYCKVAVELVDQVDLVVFGHAHCLFDNHPSRPRVVVLGDWMKRPSFLRIDERGARQFIGEEALVGPWD